MTRKQMTMALSGLCLMLSACVEPAATDRPDPQVVAGEAVTPPEPSQPSAESVALTKYFASVETFLKTQGNLRTDGGGKGTPFDVRRVTNAFMNIAFYSEFVSRGDTSVAQKTPKELEKWQGSLRIALEFGASAQAARITRDTRAIDTFLSRLSGLSGLPVGRATSDTNVLMLVLNDDERRAALPRIQDYIGPVDAGTLATIRDPARSTYCFALTVDSNDDKVIDKALVLIRAETPDLLRLSCFHEELAQMMGLTNDDPAARPSIFNDDEEFATLTKMDEYLMRILYDPRLKPGMTGEQGRPIVEVIAADLLGQASGS